MRVSMHIDSATTEQLRPLLAALSGLGLHESATVGLNGPECWTATTPPLTPNQFARVAAGLVKHNGVTLAELLNGLDRAPQ